MKKDEMQKCMLVFRGRNLSENTIRSYRSIVAQFIASVPNRKRLTWAEITEYITSKKSRSASAQTYGALKIYYQAVLGRKRLFNFIPFPKSESRLPIIPTKKVILGAIASLANPKHRCIVTILYGCGLRVSELTGLRWEDVVDRKLLHVRGKGRKDRMVPLSNGVLTTLVDFCKNYGLRCDTVKTDFIFGGVKPYSNRSVQAIIERMADATEYRITPHLLRHACFTHMRDAGTDLAAIQEIAGHTHLNTTRIYARLSPGTVTMPI